MLRYVCFFNFIYLSGEWAAAFIEYECESDECAQSKKQKRQEENNKFSLLNTQGNLDDSD